MYIRIYYMYIYILQSITNLHYFGDEFPDHSSDPVSEVLFDPEHSKFTINHS